MLSWVSTGQKASSSTHESADAITLHLHLTISPTNDCDEEGSWLAGKRIFVLSAMSIKTSARCPLDHKELSNIQDRLAQLCTLRERSALLSWIAGRLVDWEKDARLMLEAGRDVVRQAYSTTTPATDNAQYKHTRIKRISTSRSFQPSSPPRAFGYRSEDTEEAFNTLRRVSSGLTDFGAGMTYFKSLMEASSDRSPPAVRASTTMARVNGWRASSLATERGMQVWSAELYDEERRRSEKKVEDDSKGNKGEGTPM